MSTGEYQDKSVNEAQAAQIADSEDFTGGFFKKEKSDWLRFQIFDGSICLRFDEMAPGREGPIETQNPRTKEKKQTWVERFDSLVVKVVNLEKYRKEFDNGSKVTNYNFTVLSGKKRATLQLVYMDAMLRKFLKVAPNIDFNKYIRFAAFKIDNKQRISIKQGSGENFKEWPAVPFYWQHEIKDGRPDYDTPAVGADGTVMPPVVDHYDAEEDSHEYDFKAQNKFLIQHFVENTLPKIKAIAKEMGIEGFQPPPTEAELTHTGPAIPIVTERPTVVTALGLDDAMTTSQASDLRKLCKRLGQDPDKVVRAVLKEEISFDDLSQSGAAYLKYRIEKKIKKAQAEDPTAYPDPDASVLKDHIQKMKAEKATEDDDDDDWGEVKAPAKKPVEDEDEDDWGEAKAPVKSAFHDTDDSDDE